MLKNIVATICISMILPSFAMADTPAYYMSASERLVEKAYGDLGQENLFDALMTFEKAIVANPKNIKAYHGLGLSHMALENYDLALKYIDMALMVEPSSLTMLKDKGMVLIDLDDESAAKDVLDKMRFICAETACPQGDELESALTAALQQKVAEISPE